MYDVLCMGLTSCDLIFSKLEGFPRLGREAACEDFIIKPGGAANTPVALAKLGMDTVFVTTIGKDILGKIVYESLEKSGLNMTGVIYEEGYRTSVSAVLSVGEERGFATYFAKGGNDTAIERIEKLVPQCRHIHTYIHDCLNMPIVEIAKKHNRTISIDTAWDESIKLKDIKNIVESCDVFLTNEVEACSITGAGTAEKAALEIGKHAKLVVVKLGEKGCIVRQGGNEIRVPAVNGIEVKDTTGAGDLFGAGFVYGYLKGWDIEKTARFASASGGVAATFYGGMDETYTMERVCEYMDLLLNYC